MYDTAYPKKPIKSVNPDFLRRSIVIVVTIVVGPIVGFVLAFIGLEIQSVGTIPAQSQEP